MDSVIVTGATGFIGSWLVQELLKNNIKTTVIVRDRNKLLPEFLKNPDCIIVEGYIGEMTKTCFECKHYDVFFHLAWAGVEPENKNNIELQLENISMSMAALELANRIGCGKFIAAGTVAEYAFSRDIMNLHERQSPNDMYGAAKVSTHYFLDVRARQIGQPFIWVVIPSTFGERRKGNNILTYTISTLLEGKKPSYGNLNQMWDFLYVAEVARAMRLIGEMGIQGKVYGIGSGQFKPLRKYIEIIRDIINPELELGIGEIPSMSQQTFSSCVNTFEITADTGFVPEISFEEGIIKTIDSYSMCFRSKKDKEG